MSDISLYENEMAAEDLHNMPSETVTDTDIPDQTALPYFEEAEHVDR